MRIYKSAADLLIKRLYGIYGPERINQIAGQCGLETNSSGEIASVIPDEEQALKCLWEKVKTELGPVAVIGSRVTLMGFFLRSTTQMPEWIK